MAGSSDYFFPVSKSHFLVRAEVFPNYSLNNFFSPKSNYKRLTGNNSSVTYNPCTSHLQACIFGTVILELARITFRSRGGSYADTLTSKLLCSFCMRALWPPIHYGCTANKKALITWVKKYYNRILPSTSVITEEIRELLQLRVVTTKRAFFNRQLHFLYMEFSTLPNSV